MAFDPAALVARFHAAINALDFPAIDDCLAQDATYLSGKIGLLRGRNEIMAAFRRYLAEYPDQVAEDSLVEAVSANAARSVWRLAAGGDQRNNRNTAAAAGRRDHHL